MIMSKALMVLFLSLSLCLQMLAAVEAKGDNSTEERLTQLEKKIEILTSIMNSSEAKVAELVETKTNAIEKRLASLEASVTEAQSSPAVCKYQFLYQYEKEAPHSSADSQRVAKLESELTRLQEKVSALEKRLQDNDSLHNTSMLAMEGVAHSMTELVAASDHNLHSIMQNATEILASMMSKSEARLLASTQNTTSVVNAFITKMEQTTKELATCVSAMKDNLDNTTSLLTEETERIKAMLEDLKNKTEEMRGSLKNRWTCQDYYRLGHRVSRVYSLDLQDGQGPMDVYCNMSEGPGWVVFQRRQDGSVDFYRNWTSYEDGFGDLRGEFWLGNRNIHRLTRAGLTQLRVNLQAWNGSTAFAAYSHFSVGDASSSYTLFVTGYSGTAGDSLSRHSGYKFSTYDRDQDVSNSNCAAKNRGAWWYWNCAYSSLNGVYGPRGSSDWQYLWWRDWLELQSLQETELKLK